MSLKERVILVTGGASGIGRAASICCARAGARVAVADCDGDGIAATVREIDGSRGEARGFQVDVRAEGEVRAMVDSVAGTFGRIDGLIHSAGILEGALVPVDLFETETWDRVLDVNLKGSFLLCNTWRRFWSGPAGGCWCWFLPAPGCGEAVRPRHTVRAKGAYTGSHWCSRSNWLPGESGLNALCPGSLDTPLKMEVLKKTGGPGGAGP